MTQRGLSTLCVADEELWPFIFKQRETKRERERERERGIFKSEIEKIGEVFWFLSFIGLFIKLNDKLFTWYGINSTSLRTFEINQNIRCGSYCYWTIKYILDVAVAVVKRLLLFEIMTEQKQDLTRLRGTRRVFLLRIKIVREHIRQNKGFFLWERGQNIEITAFENGFKKKKKNKGNNCVNLWNRIKLLVYLV